MNIRIPFLSSAAAAMVALCCLFPAEVIFAGDATQPKGVEITVRAEDGTSVEGIVIWEDENSITILTPAGVEATIPKAAIVTRKEAGALHPDPNYSRLMFAPTGRPLKKGEGYFSDYWVLFPGVAYGVTGNFSILGGFSIIPGVALDEQAAYIAPRLGKNFTDTFAASFGAIFASFGGEFAAGIAFATATWGPLDRCVTAGCGISKLWGGNLEPDEQGLELDEQGIILIGGNYRLSNSISIISENWLLPGNQVSLDQYPFGIAARFFGERIAVDAGFILAGKILKEGFPMPWLSFVYNFS